MDPSSILNASPSSSSSLNGAAPAASDYNLAEIWPFPLGESSGGRKAAQLGAGFGEMGTGSRVHMSVVDDSVVTEYSNINGDASGKRPRDHSAASDEDESSKFVYTSSGNQMQNHGSGKRMKALGNADENGDSKPELEASSGAGNKPAERTNQPSETPKQDYIHVRARRGQATDSHSLAERARREKISERMRILQDLVPGCNKVIGKAMVLDEIINYIQSLQRQVEFLSMKLEAVNSRMTPSIDGFPTKDFGAQTIDAAGMPFVSQTPREYGHEPAQEWLHMQVGGGFERPT